MSAAEHGERERHQELEALTSGVGKWVGGLEELFIIMKRKLGGSVSDADVLTVTTGIHCRPTLTIMINHSAFFACLPFLTSDCIAQLIYQAHCGAA